jgi:hypothetical protein
MPINSTIHSAWRAARAEFADSALGEKLHLGLKTAAAAGIAGLMTLGPANAYDKFYERFGDNIQEIDFSAALELKPEYWEVLLFKRGATPSPKEFADGHWGSDTDKDLDTLMDRIRGGIASDHLYERWCGCDGGDLVHDNYFGPIAVMPDFQLNSPLANVLRTVTDWKDKLEALQEKADKVQEVLDDIEKITGTDDPEKALEDLQKKVQSLDPSAIKGFVENLQFGLRQFAGLKAVLYGAGAMAGDTALLLSQATQDLEAAQRYGQTIKREFNQANLPQNYEDTETFSYPDTADQTNKTVTYKVSFDKFGGNNFDTELRVEVTTSYTHTGQLEYDYRCNPFMNPSRPGENGYVYSQCMDKAQREHPNAHCDPLGRCTERENNQIHTSKDEWQAAVYGTYLELEPRQNDKTAWQVDVICSDHCVGMENIAQVMYRGIIYFNTEEKAKKLITKFNALDPLATPERPKVRAHFGSQPPHFGTQSPQPHYFGQRPNP